MTEAMRNHTFQLANVEPTGKSPKGLPRIPREPAKPVGVERAWGPLGMDDDVRTPEAFGLKPVVLDANIDAAVMPSPVSEGSWGQLGHEDVLRTKEEFERAGAVLAQPALAHEAPEAAQVLVGAAA